MSSTPSFHNLRLSVGLPAKARTLALSACALLTFSCADNLLAQNNNVVATGTPVVRQTTSVVAQYPYGYYTYNVDAMNTAPANPNGQYADVQEDGATQSASEIWSAFFFGGKRHSVARPKFAFSGLFSFDSTPASDATNAPQAASQPHNPAPSQTQNRQVAAQPNQKPARAVQQRPRTPQQDVPMVDVDVETDAPTELANTQPLSRQARQTRLQELDAILAQRRPEEYAQRLAARDEDGNFNVARANRSKIRQASAEEPAEELPETLPMRPLALQISPSSYVSTRIAPLPPSASLAPAPAKKDQRAIAQTNAQQQRRAKARVAQQAAVAPQPVQRPVEQPKRLPTYRSDSDKAQPKRVATPATQPVNTEQVDDQWKGQDAETDVEVIPTAEVERPQAAPAMKPRTTTSVQRSTAQFLDPKTL